MLQLLQERAPQRAVPTRLTRGIRWGLALAALTALGSRSAQAQALSGTKVIGTDYPTLAAAITALNTNGVAASGVTFNVPAGYTETAANLVITASGTSTGPIVFQKSGTGTDPLVTAAAGVNSSTSGNARDAVFKLSGADYVTFDGIDVQDAASNTGDAQMEYGYALYRASATDGTSNNVIRNCTISLQKSNTSAVGIYLASSLASNATALTLTAASGTSSGNKFYGNTITGGNSGIELRGFNASSPYDLYDQNNEVGVTAGNTISNYGSTGTPYGVYSLYQAGLKVANNTVSPASDATSSLYGIYLSTATAASASIFNNTVTVNYGGTTGSVYGIYNGAGSSGTGNTVNIYGNSVTMNSSTATSSYWYVLYNGASPATLSIYNNTLQDFRRGGTGGVYMIYQSSSPTNAAVYNNVVQNNSMSTTGTIYGLYASGSSTGTSKVYGNTIASLSGSGSVYGAYVYYGTSVYGNKIGDLSTTGTSSTVYGLYLSSANTETVYNNLVGDLRASASTSLTAVSGLYISGPTNANVYFNTIYLNASSTGATFGTSGIYLGSTSTVLDLRNNIVVNTSTAVGTGGYTAALRRTSGTSNTVPANYAATSNNNLLYAGSPSATNLLYVEGTTSTTNPITTLTAFKLFMTGRDQNSVTESPTFVSTTASDATFLHLSTTVATQAESAGQPISGITTDYDGDSRNTSTPDIGADEGTFIGSDQTPPAITYSPLGNTATFSNRTLTVTITDASGVATGTGAPRIYYKLSTASTYYSALATTVSGSTYTFTIDYANIGGTPTVGAVVQYYVAAQDITTAINVSTSPAGGSGTNPPGSTAPGTPNSYQILPTLVGTYYVTANVGSSPAPTKEFATLTAAVNAWNNSGLGGAVSFVLLDASYSSAESFPLVLNANPDASATNTLTIKPGTGVSAVVSGSVGTGAILKLNGADYVTIDGSNNGTTSQNLTFSNTSTTTTGNAVLWLASASTTDGATYNTVKNTIVTGASITAPQMGIIVGGSTGISTGPTTLAASSNTTIQNNQVSKVVYGIFQYGTSATLPDQNLVVNNNVVGTSATSGIGASGIQLQYASSVTVNKNTVAYVSYSSSTAYGVYLNTGTSNVTVNGNNLHDITYTGTGGYGGQGIRVASGVSNSNIRISNNFISALGGDGYTSLSNSSPTGIYLTSASTSGVTIVYNSINLTGSSTRSTSIITAGLGVESGPTGLTVKNNIFANSYTNSVTTTSKAYAIYSNAAASAYTSLNYNDYYVSGTQGVLGYFNTADQATLAALRLVTGKDSSSVNLDPMFASATDLHSYNSGLAVGTPISGITTDYDGDTRSTTAPYIGADESPVVAIDAQPTALVTPAANSSCYSTAEAVTVTVRNGSTTTPLSFATNPLTVTVSVTGTATQTFTTTISTNAGNPGGTALAAGGTVNVTLPGTLDMSRAGTYSFAVTASVTGDQNANNNVLATQTRTVVAPALTGISASVGSVCGATGTITLTANGVVGGTVNWYSSASNYTTVIGTGPTLTTTLTSTTSYQAKVICGSNSSAFSAPLTVTLNNPQVATAPSPVVACAGGTATLTATASTGSAVRFFSTATGGTPLATANSYTTPALSANTTYYVEAFAGGTEAVGKPSTNGADGTNSGGGLYFTTTSALNLVSVTVYQAANAAAASGTVYLLSGSTSSTTGALASTSITVPANTTSAAAATVLTLNFTIPAAGNYTLYYSGSSSPYLLRDYSSSSGISFPYTSPSGAVSITNGTLSGYYYYFYNWQVSNECVNGTRTAIQVNVTPAPATPTITVTGTPATGITLTSSAATGNQWYLNGVAITGATGPTYVVNSGVKNGSYTVVVTSGGCSATSAATNVTVTASAAALAGTSLRVYPNPTPTGQVTLELTGFRLATELTVLDALGRVVSTELLPANSGTALHTLDLKGAASGVYLLRLRNTDGVETHRLVRE